MQSMPVTLPMFTILVSRCWMIYSLPSIALMPSIPGTKPDHKKGCGKATASGMKYKQSGGCPSCPDPLLELRTTTCMQLSGAALFMQGPTFPHAQQHGPCCSVSIQNTVEHIKATAYTQLHGMSCRQRQHRTLMPTTPGEAGGGGVLTLIGGGGGIQYV